MLFPQTIQIQHTSHQTYPTPLKQQNKQNSSSTANAVMEAAAKNNSPVMIQASNGGGQFMAGKSIKDKNACAAGAVALALHVRTMAPYYGIPVILHSDHCAKKLLPWFDAMIDANEVYFAQYGEPLFSSHMLDLSEEPDEENIAICVQYFKKMGKFCYVLFS